MSLFEKIAAIMADIPAIGNDKQITTKDGKALYNVAGIQGVMKIMRPQFVKHKITIVPTESVTTVIGSVAIANVKYKLIDLESGETLDLASSGGGFDTSDKHVAKASTNAYRIAILRTFGLVSTDEDIDLFSSDENVEQEKMAKAQKVAAISSNEALVAYIDDLASRGKIEAGQRGFYAAKALAIKSPEELAEAVAWFKSFDR